MIVRNNITEVAYNVQTTVDEKYNLPIDYKVTNTNDSKAMGNMLQRAKSILRTNEFTALYDKGYHTGSEFEAADNYGKAIQRSEYTELINQNKERIENNRNYYRRRQAIVEHPYGTIKRQWGFSYISTKKGKERASSDVGFMFIAYNLRRIMNIVGKNAFKKYLEVLVLLIFRIYSTIRLKISLLKAINYLHKILPSYFEGCLNRLKFDQNLLSTGGF